MASRNRLTFHDTIRLSGDGHKNRDAIAAVLMKRGYYADLMPPILDLVEDPVFKPGLARVMTVRSATRGKALEVHVVNDIVTISGIEVDRSDFPLEAPVVVPQPTKTRRSPRTLDKASRKYLTVRNKALLTENSNVLIKVLQDVLDYTPRRGDNRPPPDLWFDDAAYLDDVRRLIVELKRLNDLLEKRASKATTTQASINFKKSAQKYLDSLVSDAGKRSSQAMFAAVAALVATSLYYAGFGQTAVSKVYSLFK